jgi:hypothetical protein
MFPSWTQVINEPARGIAQDRPMINRRARALPLLLALIVSAALAPLAQAHHSDRDGGGTTLAVIGDIPYGDALIAEFPADIAEINADPAVRRVIHLGDIKNGSSRCDDSYFAARFADFRTFADPLVYTPGDNEWTDCHRANNGGYLPTERLAAVRSLFFPRHGRTLGHHPRRIDFQSHAYPENVAWDESHVQFGTVHLVGSNDDQDPWFGDRMDPATGQPQPETRAEMRLRTREYTGREVAARAWIDGIFSRARRSHAAAVVLGMQADMWDSAAPPSELTAFEPVKALIADRAARFGRPVWLLEGDSHILKVDRPAGMPANLTRVVVQGSTNTPHEWLRLHVQPRSRGVLSCESVVFGSGATTPCPSP